MPRPDAPPARWAVAGVPLGLDEDPGVLPVRAAGRLGLPGSAVRAWRILRRSLDARGNRPPRFVCRVALELAEPPPADVPAGAAPWTPPPPFAPRPLPRDPGRPVIVGAGPAGLFAALRLAAHGVRPVVLERGDPLGERVRRVAAYWRRGELDPESNVAFGEGGAGTFSDGKLTYRGDDPRKLWVFEALVACGAPGEILWEARPHLGTDRLRTVIRRIRDRLLAAGCEVRFRTRAEGLIVREGRVAGVQTGSGPVEGPAVFLAPGHGAADLLAALVGQGVPAEAKGFALGLRVEVDQAALDRHQYGRWCGHPALPPAEFSVKARAGGRDVYSFCMCPGGTVVPAGTEPDGVVVNGMSGSRRSGRRANAALVVAVEPRDWGGGALEGLAWRRRWERRAARRAGPRAVPGQTVADFLRRRPSRAVPPSSCPWPVRPGDLGGCLPPAAAEALRAALPRLARQVGVLRRGLLIGVETRTSCPVRLARDETLQSPGFPGLYPVGEGAGWAGGIVSAAVDGVRAADRWLASLGAGGGGS
ncbi:NAD(P)/FAD-dependent oxidoreductase [Deferrisoma camini]|uniref:NAD(P)/FAD-dependent oxidoreductase n=1 Tax=Deferrisoma camini TaxID=1035120 RepID=UPI00046CAA34|nr:FAD-binding protein [Deferrisoma camini]